LIEDVIAVLDMFDEKSVEFPRRLLLHGGVLGLEFLEDALKLHIFVHGARHLGFDI